MSIADPDTSREYRERVAQDLHALRPLLSRRIRNNLRALADRSFDEEDILSSAWRRVDLLALQGKVRATDPAAFNALINTIVDNLVIDRSRRSQTTRQATDRIRSETRDQYSSAGNPSVDRSVINLARAALCACQKDTDRQLAELRGRGLNSRQISECIRISPQAVRKRWEVLAGILRCFLRSSSG